MSFVNLNTVMVLCWLCLYMCSVQCVWPHTLPLLSAGLCSEGDRWRPPQDPEGRWQDHDLRPAGSVRPQGSGHRPAVRWVPALTTFVGQGTVCRWHYRACTWLQDTAGFGVVCPCEDGQMIMVWYNSQDFSCLVCLAHWYVPSPVSKCTMMDRFKL